VKLGDYLTVLTDYHANGSYERLRENVTLQDVPGYAVMIRTTNFENEDFVDDLKYIDEHAYHFLAKSKVQPGDILMNKIASPGSVYRMPNLGRPVSLAMNLFLLRTDETRLDQSYAYYWLKANEPYVKGFASGAATATITKKAVRELEMQLPPLSTQRRIASILLAYDTLIESNLQRIRISEAMARAVYREWFICFRFPGHKEKHYLSLDGCRIPDDWKRSPLSNFGQLTIGGDWGEETPRDGDWCEVGCVRGVDIRGLQTHGYSPIARRWVKADSLRRRRILPVDVVVEGSGEIGCSIAGHRSLEKIFGLPLIYSNFCKRLRFSTPAMARFVAYQLNEMVQSGAMAQFRTGTTIPNLNMTALFEQHDFLMPPQDLIQRFAFFLDSLDDFRLLGQIQNLRQTRDLLLPRLLSGQVELA
jgi:type I restriction enzyme S subunit